MEQRNVNTRNVNTYRGNRAPEPIDLIPMIKMFLSKWWLIVIAAAIGGVMTLGYSVYFITPMYRSQYELYILSKTTSVTSISDLQFGSAISKDIPVIAKSKPVIDTAILNLQTMEGKTYTRKQISDAMSVSLVNDTRVLKIVVTYPDPEEACDIANALGTAVSSQIAEITKTDPPTTVERAEVAKAPVSPNIGSNALKGAAVFAAALCAILGLQFMLNEKICTEDDVETYMGTSVLAVVPLEKKSKIFANEKKKKK